MVWDVYNWRVPRIGLIPIGCLTFLGGLGLVAAGWHVQGGMWVASLCLLALCYKRRAIIAIPAVVIVGTCMGLWRGSDVAAQLQHYARFVGQKVVVTGTLAADPTYGSDSQQDMLLQDVAIAGHPLPGAVRIKSLSPIEPLRGDRIIANGKLYGGFGSYQAALYYADMYITTRAANPLDILRRTFAARIYSVLPDAQAGLGLGFLLGIKSQLPDALTTQLKLLGLTHIVVASGYNLTILVRLSRRLFVRVSHAQTTIAALAMIASFVAVTGFSASMGRAALVSGLAVIAAHYGRRVHPALLIGVAAAITSAINPLYIWSDLGWWLSFLAFAGVLLVAPLIERRVYGERQPKIIGQVVIETISAELLTLPLMLLVFGQLPVLAIIANVLVVPLIPLAMLLTFLAGIAGSVVPFIAWPAIWLLGYICQIITALAAVPWAAVPFALSPGGMVGIYAALAFGCVLLWRRVRYDYLSQSVVE